MEILNTILCSDARKHCSVEEIRDRVFEIKAFPRYAMTGGIGWIVLPNGLLCCGTLQGQYTSGACSVAQKAAEAAYTGNQSCGETMRAAFERRRNLVVELVRQIPGMKVSVPQGAFYVFPDCSAYLGKSFNGKVIENSADLAMFLLETAQVASVGGVALLPLMHSFFLRYIEII
jgi:aspartate aminotransferase